MIAEQSLPVDGKDREAGREDAKLSETQIYSAKTDLTVRYTYPRTSQMQMDTAK